MFQEKFYSFDPDTIKASNLTLGGFKGLIENAVFFPKNFPNTSVTIEVDFVPAVIHFSKCTDCDDTLKRSKIFDTLRLINWVELDSGTIATLVSNMYVVLCNSCDLFL